MYYCRNTVAKVQNTLISLINSHQCSNAIYIYIYIILRAKHSNTQHDYILLHVYISPAAHTHTQLVVCYYCTRARTNTHGHQTHACVHACIHTSSEQVRQVPVRAAPARAAPPPVPPPPSPHSQMTAWQCVLLLFAFSSLQPHRLLPTFPPPQPPATGHVAALCAPAAVAPAAAISSP